MLTECQLCMDWEWFSVNIVLTAYRSRMVQRQLYVNCVVWIEFGSVSIACELCVHFMSIIVNFMMSTLIDIGSTSCHYEIDTQPHEINMVSTWYEHWSTLDPHAVNTQLVLIYSQSTCNWHDLNIDPHSIHLQSRWCRHWSILNPYAIHTMSTLIHTQSICSRH